MSVYGRFAVGDKVVWADKHYAEFIESRDPNEVLTVSGFDECYIRFEEFPIGAFIHRFEKLSESIQNPHLVGKTAMKNDDLCEDKQTPTFGDNDENMWFKRGELPPAGTSCEVDDRDGWYEAIIIGIDSQGYAVYESPWKSVPYDGDNCPKSFRPIKSPEQLKDEEREKAIDEIMSDLNLCADCRYIASRVFDKGYCKQEKSE